MATQISYLNPVRFHKNEVDFNTYLPKQDLMKPSVQYQRGQYPVDWFVDWDVNFEITIQVFGDESTYYTAKVTDTETGDVEDYIDQENITPSDYEDSNIYLIRYTFPRTGYFRIDIRTPDLGYIFGDVIHVQEWSDKKNLVKIDFSDTENSHGGVFYDSSGNKIWSPCAFYSGYVRKLPPTFETEEFQGEMNNRFETLSTPAINSELTVTDLFCQYMDNLGCQLSCDESFVNGEQISKSDFNEDSIEKSTITNVTISLSRNDNDNFQKLS